MRGLQKVKSQSKMAAKAKAAEYIAIQACKEVGLWAGPQAHVPMPSGLSVRGLAGSLQGGLSRGGKQSDS